MAYMAYNPDRGFETDPEWMDTNWGYNPGFPLVWPLIEKSYIIENSANLIYSDYRSAIAYFPRFIDPIYFLILVWGYLFVVFRMAFK